MSFRPHPKYARTDPASPSAWATCDRCGMQANLRDLVWDREWSGTQIINRRFLVHPHCYTIPNETLRTIVLPVDPEPLVNTRPESYAIDEGVGVRVTADRKSLRVVLVSPGGPRRPFVSTGIGALQTSF